jgi:hypothetical protein
MMVLSASAAYADQTVGGVAWLDSLAYKKPAFVSITIPTIATNYYVEMTSGSDTGTCGASTATPCNSLRGLVDRNLSGLRGNAADGAAAINIRGNGTGSFYIYNNTLAGTPGKEILIRPWGTTAVTFKRGGSNQGLNAGPGVVHDIIIDGGDPATGNMLFSFVADDGNCGAGCSPLAISGNNVTVARTQFYATGTAGSGWPTLVLVCNVDGLSCSGDKFINNEFYGCSVGSSQCSAIYLGPCTASGGCSVNNILIKNNVIRHMGGEGLEVNPRTTSSNIIIEGNAFHDNGYATCNDGGFRSCRPAIVLNINQSGAVNSVIVRNNLMWDISSGCIWEKTGATGANAAQIYNNTCFDYGKGTSTNTQPQGISSALFGSTAIVRDNIIYAPNGTNPLDSTASFVADHNLCASGKSCGLAARTWSAVSVVSVSPSAASFLQIDGNSEAASVGVAVAALTIDYAAAARVLASWDIGAFTVPTTGLRAPTNLRIIR